MKILKFQVQIPVVLGLLVLTLLAAALWQRTFAQGTRAPAQAAQAAAQSKAACERYYKQMTDSLNYLEGWTRGAQWAEIYSACMLHESR